MKQKLIFALLMGLITTGVISFTLVGVNLSFGPQFLMAWFRSWTIAYLLVVPAILWLGPLVQRFVNRLYSDQKNT